MPSWISSNTIQPCPADLGNGLPSRFFLCSDYGLRFAIFRTKAKSGPQFPISTVGEAGDGCTEAGVPRSSWELITWARLG